MDDDPDAGAESGDEAERTDAESGATGSSDPEPDREPASEGEGRTTGDGTDPADGGSAPEDAGDGEDATGDVTDATGDVTDATGDVTDATEATDDGDGSAAEATAERALGDEGEAGADAVDRPQSRDGTTPPPGATVAPDGETGDGADRANGGADTDDAAALDGTADDTDIDADDTDTDADDTDTDADDPDDAGGNAVTDEGNDHARWNAGFDPEAAETAIPPSYERAAGNADRDPPEDTAETGAGTDDDGDAGTADGDAGTADGGDGDASDERGDFLYDPDSEPSTVEGGDEAAASTGGGDGAMGSAAAVEADRAATADVASEEDQSLGGTVGDDPGQPPQPDLSFGPEVGDGPDSDQEMPLADHIDEMIRRLAVVLAVGGVVTLVLYPGADLLNAYAGTSLPTSTGVINYLWNSHIPGAETVAGRRPRIYGPLELLLTELKVAALAGFLVSLPVFVYETYLFMRPGLYPHERRYYLSAVPTSVVLAFVGVAFAHFVVLPTIFAYFTSYTTGAATVAFGLKETFSLILVLMGYMALVFQIPLFIMLAIMMDLVTREWMEDRRLLFWGGFLGLSFLVSPDPTGMAPIIVAATMIALFEGTLALLRWTGN